MISLFFNALIAIFWEKSSKRVCANLLQIWIRVWLKSFLSRKFWDRSKRSSEAEAVVQLFWLEEAHLKLSLFG